MHMLKYMTFIITVLLLLINAYILIEALNFTLRMQWLKFNHEIVKLFLYDVEIKLKLCHTKKKKKDKSHKQQKSGSKQKLQIMQKWQVDLYDLQKEL